MNAIKRLKLATDVARAIEANDMEKLCKIVGMDDPMFDNLPALELIEILNVRLHDLVKELGIINE